MLGAVQRRLARSWCVSSLSLLASCRLVLTLPGPGVASRHPRSAHLKLLVPRDVSCCSLYDGRSQQTQGSEGSGRVKGWQGWVLASGLCFVSGTFTRIARSAASTTGPLPQSILTSSAQPRNAPSFTAGCPEKSRVCPTLTTAGQHLLQYPAVVRVGQTLDFSGQPAVKLGAFRG